MHTFAPYERDMLVAKAAGALGVIAVLLGCASLLPGFMYLLDLLIYLFILLYWMVLLCILLVGGLLPTLLTLGTVWFADAFQGYRNFMGGVVAAFDVSALTDALPAVTNSIVEAYSVLYPVFAALTVVIGVPAIVLGARKRGMDGAMSGLACGITAMSFALVGAIAFYAVIPLIKAVVVV